jgi:hypothetical protein
MIMIRVLEFFFRNGAASVDELEILHMVGRFRWEI